MRIALLTYSTRPRGGVVHTLALANERPGLELVVAGGETLFDYRPYRAEVERRCAELDVAPVVLGTVDDDELPALMAQASAFAFPSTKEGFGMAAMEALAAGVPVVARDLPVLGEVFGGAARFASSPAGFCRQLVAALDEPSPTLAASGRALAARHTWTAAAEAHRALYATIGRRSVAAG